MPMIGAIVWAMSSSTSGGPPTALSADRTLSAAAKRLEHWQGVVHSACGQSGRARVPAIAPPRPLAEALQAFPDGPRLMLDPAAPLAMRDALAPAAPGCVLAIGPEGGWSSRDAMQLAGAGFSGVRLGPRVLRTETAGLAAIAALQAVHGDLR